MIHFFSSTNCTREDSVGPTQEPGMTIDYHCPVCRGVTSLPDEKEGTLAACSRCQLKFIAPAPGSSVPPESSSSHLFDSNATEVFDGSESSAFDRAVMPDSSVFERPDPTKKEGYDPFEGQVPGFEDRDAFRTASGRFTPLRKSPLSEAGSPFEPFTPSPDENLLGDIPVPPPLPSTPSLGVPAPAPAPAPAPNPFAAPIPELPTNAAPMPPRMSLDGAPPKPDPAPAAPNPFAAPVPEPGAMNPPPKPAPQPAPQPAPRPSLPSTASAAPNPFAAPVPENKVTQRPPAPQRPPRPAPAAPNPFAAPVPESSKHAVPPKNPAAQFTPSIRPQKSAPKAAPAPKKEQEYSLLVVEGLAEQLFRFQQGSSYVVGRDVAAGIKIMSKSVSRRHARIETTGPTPVLIDLGSANGTIVNGTKVSRLVLRDGDLIKIGQVILRFQNES